MRAAYEFTPPDWSARGRGSPSFRLATFTASSPRDVIDRDIEVRAWGGAELT
jgi:hypothetical protein